MLTLYRRHSFICPKRADRYWKRCTCAMWTEGVTAQGHYIRRSLKTSSWERAASRMRALEDDGETAKQRERVTVDYAISEFLADARGRGLTASSLRQFERIDRRQFAGWCLATGIKYVNELDVAVVRNYRETWSALASQTRSHRQVHLRQFFRFCIQNKWIDDNPADALGRIKVVTRQTEYFTPDEMSALLDAALCTDRLNDHRGGLRLHALIQLMRWSGLRITDAITLERSRVSDRGELHLRQMKTKQPVWVPLPAHVTDALRYMPPSALAPNPRYFFWSGRGQKETAADVMHKAFRRVAKRAGIEKRCHPHMLRDTFAVEMLLAGVPLDQVSIMLGHSSIRMTEKHYAPWVRARQDQLMRSVKRAWLAGAANSADESES